MTIVDTIKKETAGDLERAAVIDGDREVTYGELFALVEKVACELGIGAIPEIGAETQLIEGHGR